MSIATESLSETVARLSRELPDRDAPPMGVHTLSEFVFCPRAGAISAQAKETDRGSELPRAPALGGLPWHDIDRIENAIEQLLHQIKIPIGWNMGLWLLALYVCLALTPAALLVFAPAFYYCGRWLYDSLSNYQMLKKRLRAASLAAPREANWELPQPQPINWWSLVRAGFISIEKQESLLDESIGLAGKPWRVLHRGNVEYPVLRIKVDDQQHDPRREGRLRRQQLARIAAYAYLLHRCERADSSWAIVLFGSSDEGIAVPVSAQAWQAFYGGLMQAREQLQSSRDDPHYTPPKNIDACVGCPLGKPTRLGRETPHRNGVPITPFGTETVEGIVYHSTCGDHYRWVPPHELSKKLGLGR